MRAEQNLSCSDLGITGLTNNCGINNFMYQRLKKS